MTINKIKTSKGKACDSLSTQTNYRGTAADTPGLKKVHGLSEKPKEFVNSFDQEIDLQSSRLDCDETKQDHLIIHTD